MGTQEVGGGEMASLEVGGNFPPLEVGGGERAPLEVSGGFSPLEVSGGERAPPEVGDLEGIEDGEKIENISS